MTVREIEWTNHLDGRVPADVRDEVRAEVDRFVAALPDDAACLVTGSLVEGIGNTHSDIDLYVVQTAASAVAKPISIGIRKSRYVDCEYLTDQNVERLAAALVRTDAETLLELSLRDFSRYYRIAIGVPVRVPDVLAGTLALCGVDRARAGYARWSALRAWETMARAAVAHALGESRPAVVLLREAALWRANAVLARAGEGYPSLKWTEVKAARRFGAGSAEYRSALTGYLDGGEDVGRDVARMRERVAPPDGVLDAMTRRDWRLAPGARHVADGTDHYLLLGRTSMTRLGGITALVVGHLADTGDWVAAAAAAAVDLSVPHDEVVAAVFPHLGELAAAGCLVSAGEQEG